MNAGNLGIAVHNHHGSQRDTHSQQAEGLQLIQDFHFFSRTILTTEGTEEHRGIDLYFSLRPPTLCLENEKCLLKRQEISVSSVSSVVFFKVFQNFAGGDCSRSPGQAVAGMGAGTA